MGARFHTDVKLESLILSQSPLFAEPDEQGPLAIKVQRTDTRGNLRRSTSSSRASWHTVPNGEEDQEGPTDLYRGLEFFEAIVDGPQRRSPNLFPWIYDPTPLDSEVPDTVWSLGSPRTPQLPEEPKTEVAPSSLLASTSRERVVVLVGPSGSGKTSFVNQILGESDSLRRDNLLQGKILDAPSRNQIKMKHLF